MAKLLHQELEKLNSNQKLAVHATEGRLLILAGAGSGKTKVLTLRMAHLIGSHGVSPQSILGLTFTNKAAAEMRERIASILSESDAKQLTLCTFHSFCMHVLRKEIDKLGYTRHFSLYDAYDVQRLITQICRELLQHESALPSLAPTIALINHARNHGIVPGELKLPGSSWHDSFVPELYSRFCSSMKAYNALDFDNLLCLTVQLFEEHPEVLCRYQERFVYLMIDEYQDTNPIQYKLASLLSSKSNNLCVVGDDDQSIYGWRGAQIAHILNFENAMTVKLEQNYRSNNTILKAANAVIKNNQTRHHKELWSAQGDGELIEIFHAPTEIQEAEAVIHRLALQKERLKLSWGEIAILYRSNALSRQFEQALLKYTWKKGDQWIRGIPYQIFGGEEYYERREVKDLMAYLRFLLNPLDQEALLRIINLPRRGIGDETLDKLTSYNRSIGLSLWEVIERACSSPGSLPFSLSDKIRSSLQNFRELFQTAREQFTESPLHIAMQWLIEKIEFKRAIEEEVKSDQMRQFKWDNVQEFVSALAEYTQSMTEQGREAEASLHDFVTSTPLGSDKSFQKKKNRSNDMVNLMTFHSAKGLEFTACFLVGMEDQIIPHEKSLLETGIEEERRLMYVAITRAKKLLTCSMARMRKRMGVDTPSRPSRFLSEIPKDLLKITPWDHPLL